MALYLSDVKEMKLKRTPFFLPINIRNKRKNSVIFLMAPNTESSIALMKNPLTINRNLFQSYYIERDINFMINESNINMEDEPSSIVFESCIMEMTAKERNALPDSAFGLEDERKYPLDTPEHVRSAIKLFGHCPENRKTHLAKKIMVAAKKFNIEVKENTEVWKYAHGGSSKSESVALYQSFTESASYIDEHCAWFAPDDVERIIFSESGNSGILRKMLYDKRIRNQKDAALIYDKIKEQCDFIKYTFLNYKLYRQRNLFVDWSYYTETFFDRLKFKMDKAMNLYFDFTNKFIQDKRLADNGYTEKTIFLPVQDWCPKNCEIWDYTKSTNPISLIYRMIRTRRTEELQKNWGGIDWVFMTDQAYFKMRFDEFDQTKLVRWRSLIGKLAMNDVADAEFDSKDSSQVIAHKLADRIEDSGIEIDDLSGGAAGISAEELGEYRDISGRSQTIADKTGIDKDLIDKAMLMQKIKRSAEASSNENEALENMNSDEDSAWLKNLIIDLQSEDGPKVSNARTNRMKTASESFLNKKIDNMKVSDLIQVNKNIQDIPADNIPIESINEEWKDVKFSNFSKAYNLEADIYATLGDFSSKTAPIVILSVDKEDTSTTEDFVETWTIKMEDLYGKRFTAKVDIPILQSNRFMKLRGNYKTINGQLMNLPIIKTDEDTAQIVSNYNKIFIRRVNPSNGTKTSRQVSILVKFLKSYTGKDLTIIQGDNSFVSSKYELPIEFADLSGNYSKIQFKDGSFISFNMEEYAKYPVYKDHVNKPSNGKVPFMVDYDGKVRSCTQLGYVGSVMSTIQDKLKDPKIFDDIKPDKRLSYSEASILATTIPVIVVMAYSEGLQKSMQKAGIKYEFSEKKPNSKEYEYIKFNDGYVVYDPYSISASLLMSGLYQCNTEDYSIRDIDNKQMWLDFLDNFGGRLKADGLDNFYDCMMDPITREICDTYNLPSDYCSALAYASDLLADNKYNKHTDISGNRIRTNEIIAATFQKVMYKAYGDYHNQLKKNKRNASFSLKQSAVIDELLLNPTCSDLSIDNPQHEAEEVNSLSFKGLSGMNSDRSYTLDKRVYDPSMFGVISTSTGFSGNTGLTRQATINASVKGVRGMIVTPKNKDIGTLNGLSIHEAMNPWTTTRDDPIRVAMGYVQSTKHPMRIKKSMPNLVTTGMDEAMPYMTSDFFSYTFKGKKGTVLEVTDRYIIVQDDDTKQRDFISLEEKSWKNSDGGFYVTIKLDSFVKKGQKLKNNDIIAYDKTCYKTPVGADANCKNLSYSIGAMCKLAIMSTDEGYEDSSIIDEYLADALTSSYVVMKEKILAKDSNLYNIVQKGQEIKEGEPLMIFQNAFEEEDANALLRNVHDAEVAEDFSDFGRIHIRSKVSGIIQDIKVYRTCDISELSPSLKKLVNAYEKTIKADKALFEKYKIPGAKHRLEPDYKLDPIGKLKKARDSVLIEFYIKVEDKMGVGDKLIYNNAIKGVVKDIMAPGNEPRTKLRPDEPINALLSTGSVNARMVASILINGSVNKCMVELDRKCKEILGISWKNLDQM